VARAASGIGALITRLIFFCSPGASGGSGVRPEPGRRFGNAASNRQPNRNIRPSYWRTSYSWLPGFRMARPRLSATFVAGLITAGAGLYFVAAGLRQALVPGAAPAPGLLVVCAGLAFGLSGLRAATQSLLDSETAEPADGAETAIATTADAAPWIREVQSFAPLPVAFCLGVIITWIAVAGGGSTLACLAFGFGALVTWACFLVLVHARLRDTPPARRDTAESVNWPHEAAEHAVSASPARDGLFDAGTPRARRRPRPPFRLPIPSNRKAV